MVADIDGGELARVLRQDVIGSLEDGRRRRRDRRPTEDAARAAVADGDGRRGVHRPGRASPTAIQAGQAVTLEVVGAQDARPGDRGRARGRASASATASSASSSRWRRSAASGGGPLGTGRSGGVRRPRPRRPRPPVALVDATTDLRQLSLATYFGASMAILFLFFSAQVGMVSLFEERRQGTLAPDPRGPVRPGRSSSASSWAPS